MPISDTPISDTLGDVRQFSATTLVIALVICVLALLVIIGGVGIGIIYILCEEEKEHKDCSGQF
jgi:hypothetical protein